MRLADYQKPSFNLTQTILEIELGHQETIVRSVLHLEHGDAKPQMLHLDGQALTLLEIAMDGTKLSTDAYECDEHGLSIKNVHQKAVLCITVRIHPNENNALSGLYASGDNLCTQCESQGFRRITYSLDRPDVLSRYQVTLIADPDRYPLLLANGDKVADSIRADGMRQVTFVDPAPKPSYLFAVIAGQFVSKIETYIASDGREHELAIHLPQQYPLQQADIAMEALKQAMRWDEETYGCFYDLDAYHVVAMPDFNFGAMENKGLNIFNTSALLADPAVATDASHLRVHTVVGHEYFHNWTGNRVTVRDWFQISLKEGLTTYREMCFAMATYGPLARLDYVFDLVERQFAEDAGPSAHALLPQTAHSIENLYTATTYTKGAEVLRMLEDLLGHERAVQAVQAYLKKFDGQAACIEDFLDVVAQTANMDITGFLAWYHQKGTPVISLQQDYNPVAQTLTITLQQKAAREDLQNQYHPLMMPVRLKLWDMQANTIEVSHPDAKQEVDGGLILTLTETKQTWVFSAVPSDPIVSFFRGLSAPVMHRQNINAEESGLLIACEEDLYTRYQQAQTQWLEILRGSGEISPAMAAALDKVIGRAMQNPQALDVVLRIPDVIYCQETVGGFDFDALCDAHEKLGIELAKRWEPEWVKLFKATSDRLDARYTWSPEQAAFRRVRAIALKQLIRADQKYICLAEALYREADNISDQMAALSALICRDSHKVEILLEDFYHKAKDHDLQLDRWFWLQAGRHSTDPLANLQNLLAHDACDWRRPNRIMTTFAGWLSQHSQNLHATSGQGYDALASAIIRLDGLNPSTAARLVRPLMRWRCYNEKRQAMLRAVLIEIQAKTESTMLSEKLEQALAIA